jgi:hypothetical protein
VSVSGDDSSSSSANAKEDALSIASLSTPTMLWALPSRLDFGQIWRLVVRLLVLFRSKWWFSLCLNNRNNIKLLSSFIIIGNNKLWVKLQLLDLEIIFLVI